MSKFRDVLISQQSQGGGWDKYIQDGLVFQLDCDTQCDASKWTDIIGGNEFVGNKVKIVSGVPTFDGTANYYTTNSSSYIYTSHTIEIAFKYGNNSGVKIMFYNDISNGLCFGYSSVGYYISVGINHYPLNASAPTNGKFYAISVNSNVGVENMVKGSIGSSANQFASRSTSKMFVGSRNTDNMFIGSIYAIRIYDRLLSADEMQANQAIDIDRFGSR